MADFPNILDFSGGGDYVLLDSQEITVATPNLDFLLTDTHLLDRDWETSHVK